MTDETQSTETRAHQQRLATGPQLWRLNTLGLLGEALEQTPSRSITAKQAILVLAASAERGEWTPRPQRIDLGEAARRHNAGR